MIKNRKYEILGGAIPISVGLGLAGLLRYHKDTAYAAVAMHEFGHCLLLRHCPNLYCIMNNEHTLRSLLSKWNYGINFCDNCWGLIRTILDAHGVSRIRGLIVGYKYSGNVRRVADDIERWYGRADFLEYMEMDTYKLINNVEKQHIKSCGEVERDELRRILIEQGVDLEQYKIWDDRYFICELNERAAECDRRWGYSIGLMQYSFPPVVSMMEKTIYGALATGFAGFLIGLSLDYTIMR